MATDLLSMSNEELLRAFHDTEPQAAELPPGRDPPEWTPDMMVRNARYLEELQRRGFRFAGGRWIKDDEPDR